MTRISEHEYATILRNQSRPQKAATTLPCPTEAQEQAALMEWAHLSATRLPGVELLFHIPNGELRDKATAVRLKAQGVSAGVPDLCLPVARGGYHGLWLELKRADHSNHPSALQHAWMARLECEGYRVHVCYGAAAAIDAIEKYLEMP